jgi:hypothetical protein
MTKKERAALAAHLRVISFCFKDVNCAARAARSDIVRRRNEE